VLVFEVVAVEKTPDRFEHVPAAEFAVDPRAGTIEERPLADIPLRGGHAVSPVHEGRRPGSYAPAAR
jgi:hypothetical protein